MTTNLSKQLKLKSNFATRRIKWKATTLIAQVNSAIKEGREDNLILVRKDVGLKAVQVAILTAAQNVLNTHGFGIPKSESLTRDVEQHLQHLGEFQSSVRDSAIQAPATLKQDEAKVLNGANELLMYITDIEMNKALKIATLQTELRLFRRFENFILNSAELINECQKALNTLCDGMPHRTTRVASDQSNELDDFFFDEMPEESAETIELENDSN